MSTGPLRAHRRAIAAAAVGVVASGGCAERQLVTNPSTSPGAGTWAVVWVAGALVVIVAGLLLTLPAWRANTGARLAVGVLSLQAGAVAVTGSLLTAVAIRSWQLIERPADAPPAAALLRLSRVDGDTAFWTLMVLLTVVLAGLGTLLSALAARLAAGSDLVGRTVASALLAVEAGCAGYAAVRLSLGAHGWPYLAGTLALPVVVLALVTCWPRRTATSTA